MSELVPKLDTCAVLGQYVVYRDEQHLALCDMEKVAEFSSYAGAVMAVKVLRTGPAWLVAAELTLNDEDFLSVQVLARRLMKKRVAGRKFSFSNSLIPESETGIGFSEPEPSLDDLI